MNDLAISRSASPRPAAWLRRAGLDVTLVDLTKEKLDAARDDRRCRAGARFTCPVHTATRLAAPGDQEGPCAANTERADLRAWLLCAPLNAEWLRSIGA